MFVGLTLLAYHMLYAVLGWIPNDWGVHDEDGKWSQGIGYSRGTIAIFIAGATMSIAEAGEEAAACRPIEVKALRALSLALRRSPYQSETAADYRQSILRQAESALSSEQPGEGDGLRAHRNTLKGAFAPDSEPDSADERIGK